MRGIPSYPIDYRGRATSRLGRAWDRVQPLLGQALYSGWAARVTYRLGLQGHLTVREHTFELARQSSTPLRIAFASDFHAGATTHPELVEQACRALREMKPDLVLLGGDYVAFEAREIEALLPHLSQIHAPLGVYAVLGNHDLTTDSVHILSALQRVGIMMLTNRSVRLPAPHDDLLLCGLDDPTYGDPRAERAFSGGGAGARRLVLMHSPDGLLAIGDREFDIAFCGHTHGGQVALPGGIPLLLPKGKLSRRFARGIHRLRGGGTLLVSHGIGCSTLPLRLFATPEVHLCTVVGRANVSSAAA